MDNEDKQMNHYALKSEYSSGLEEASSKRAGHGPQARVN
jgi:hypothetical protein